MNDSEVVVVIFCQLTGCLVLSKENEIPTPISLSFTMQSHYMMNHEYSIYG
jgi:hypothetical protein